MELKIRMCPLKITIHVLLIYRNLNGGLKTCSSVFSQYLARMRDWNMRAVNCRVCQSPIVCCCLLIKALRCNFKPQIPLNRVWKKCQCYSKSLFWPLSFTKPVQGGNTVLIFKVIWTIRESCWSTFKLPVEIVKAEKTSVNRLKWQYLRHSHKVHAVTCIYTYIVWCHTSRLLFYQDIDVLLPLFSLQFCIPTSFPCLVGPSFWGVRKGSKVHCFFKAYSCILWFLWAWWSTRGDSGKTNQVSLGAFYFVCPLWWSNADDFDVCFMLSSLNN